MVVVVVVVVDTVEEVIPVEPKLEGKLDQKT